MLAFPMSAFFPEVHDCGKTKSYHTDTKFLIMNPGATYSRTIMIIFILLIQMILHSAKFSSEKRERITLK